MIALDTTALSALFVPGVVLFRAGSSVPIAHPKERLELLVETAATSGDQILITTPALSELFVKIGSSRIGDLLTQLKSSSWFRIESFDIAAATELALRVAGAIAAGDKREGLPKDTPWAKIKLDRQIVAIALVNGATQIVSEDADVIAIGRRWGVQVSSVEDLPFPSELIPPPLFRDLDEDSPGQEK